MLIFKWQFTSERFQEKILSGPLQWILEHSSKPFTVHRDVPSSTDRVMGDLHNMPRSGDLSWSIVGHFHGFLCRINQFFCIRSSVTYHCPPSVSLNSLSLGRCGDNLNFFSQQNKFMSNYCEVALMWICENTFFDKSTRFTWKACTWAKFDPDLCYLRASQCHNELIYWNFLGLCDT